MSRLALRACAYKSVVAPAPRAAPKLALSNPLAIIVLLRLLRALIAAAVVEGGADRLDAGAGRGGDRRE
jgi:hypothetical protein